MLIQIDAKQLRKALADIEKAEANGFMHCEAVFEAKAVVGGCNLKLAYSDMIEKAHPTDPSLDWGRFQGVTRNNKWDGKTLVPLNGQHREKVSTGR